MELKLSQELSSIDQDPLFLVLMDLSNSYDTVDRERLLITLEGYGSGPHICGLLETLWYCQQVFPRQNGFHRQAFPATKGTMQGGLVSLTLFNLVVDNVIRTWLDMTVEDQRVAHDGLVDTVGRCLGVFYSEDGMVRSRNPNWLQHVVNVPVGLFRRYGLVANVSKLRTMTCHPGALRAGMLEEAMALNCAGMGDLYRVRLRRQIPCPECGVELTAGSMMSHRRRMHRTENAIDWSWFPVIQMVHQPQV